MQDNHTPGPWKAVKDEKSNGYIDVHDAMGREVCVCYGGSGLKSEPWPEAILIAAAPELLGALEGLLADITEYQTINHLDGENNHSQVRARAAIARARGQA
jgi:hypothetical protein